MPELGPALTPLSVRLIWAGLATAAQEAHRANAQLAGRVAPVLCETSAV